MSLTRSERVIINSPPKRILVTISCLKTINPLRTDYLFSRSIRLTTRGTVSVSYYFEIYQWNSFRFRLSRRKKLFLDLKKVWYEMWEALISLQTLKASRFCRTPSSVYDTVSLSRNEMGSCFSRNRIQWSQSHPWFIEHFCLFMLEISSCVLTVYCWQFPTILV